MNGIAFCHGVVLQTIPPLRGSSANRERISRKGGHSLYWWANDPPAQE